MWNGSKREQSAITPQMVFNFFLYHYFFRDHVILFIKRLWTLSIQPKTFEAGKKATEIFLKVSGPSGNS